MHGVEAGYVWIGCLEKLWPMAPHEEEEEEEEEEHYNVKGDRTEPKC